MIIEVKGDLLNAKVEMLLECSNCFCTHSAGLAKQVKARYPEVYIADLGTRIADHKKLGTILPVLVSSSFNYDIKVVCLCYGQFRFGTERRQLNYEAFYQCMERVKEYCVKNKITKIGCPKYIGSRLAGGDYLIIRTMLESVFGSHPDIILTICEFP